MIILLGSRVDANKLSYLNVQRLIYIKAEVKLPTAKLQLHLHEEKKKVYLPVILPSKAGDIAKVLDRIRSVYFCNNKARP